MLALFLLQQSCLAYFMNLSSPLFQENIYLLSLFYDIFSYIFLIKDYHILFLIIVFRLVIDKLSPVSSTVLPKGSVTGCDSSLGGGWMIFHFR